jgi:Cu(I)/Ag(I) efflux system membrane protein CusA/SilA
MRVLLRIYDPVLDWALSHRKTVLGFATLLLIAAIILGWGLPRPAAQNLRDWKLTALADAANGMGREFMPPLNEGSLLFMPVLLPSTSLTEVKRIMSWQDQVISKVPEVVSVGGKLGAR